MKQTLSRQVGEVRNASGLWWGGSQTQWVLPKMAQGIFRKCWETTTKQSTDYLVPVVHRSWDPLVWATSPYLIGNGTEIRCFQCYPEIVAHCPWTFLSQMIKLKPVKSLPLLLKTQLGGGWKLGWWSNQAFSLTLDQHGRVLEGHQQFFKAQRTRPSTAFSGISSFQKLLKFRYCRR